MTTYSALGGDWGTPTDWSPATVPNSPDADVLLYQPAAAVTLASGGSYAVRSVSLSGDSLWVDGALQAAASVTLGAGASLTMDGGGLTASQILIGSGDTLRGSGTINGAVVDNGVIYAGAHTGPYYPANEIPESLVLNGDVSGSGMLEIGGGVSSVGSHAYSRGYGTITLNGASANPVLFEGGFGSLRLGAPSSYTGVISAENVAAFNIYYTVTAAFEIDLAGVSYASLTGFSYAAIANGGTLTVQTSSGAYALKFAAGFQASDFTFGGAGDLAITVTPKPIISGTVTGQHIDSTQTTQPFAHIQISDPLAPAQTSGYAEISVSGGAGTWSNIGSGFIGGNGDYYIDGNAAAVTAALQALVFTPTLSSINADAPQTLTFSLMFNDGAEPVVTDATTTVIVNPTTINISQPGVTINASGKTISFTAAAVYAAVNGDGDTISAPLGLPFAVTGVHDAVYLSNGQVHLGPRSDVSFVGGGDAVYGGGPGDTLGFTGGGDIAFVSNSFVYLGAGSDVVIVGDGDVANTAAAGDVMGFVGIGDLAEISNGAVYLGAGSNVVVLGDNDVANTAASGDVMGFVGTGDLAEISNGTVYLGAGSNVVVLGDNDVANTAAAGEVMGFVGGNETAEISNGTIYLGGATQVSVIGGGDVVNTAAAGDVVTFNGVSDVAEITDGTIYLAQGANVSILGDGDVAQASQPGATMTFTGAHDTAQVSNGTVGLRNASVALVGGNDTISLAHGFGTDTLYGFNASDGLQVSAQDFASAAEVLSRAFQSGADTVIVLDGDDSLRLSGVNVTSLSAWSVSVV